MRSAAFGTKQKDKLRNSFFSSVSLSLSLSLSLFVVVNNI